MKEIDIRPTTTGRHSRALPSNFFCDTPYFVVARNFFTKTYNKNKNLSPLKMYLASAKFETWLRAWLTYGSEKRFSQFCVSFISLWSQTGAFKHRKAVSLLISILWSDPHESSLIKKKICTWGRVGIFAKISWRDVLRQNEQLWSWRDYSVGQLTPNDLCIALADLFQSMLDVRVTRCAELSTDHHLVVSN